MRTLTRIGDQLAVSAALLCAIHCLFTPVVLALLPSIQSLTFVEDEAFHLWMVMGVLPTSLFALVMGCRKHKKPTFLAIGSLGLAILFSAAVWGHELVGCRYEKYLTLAGSGLVSFAHIKNYLMCRKQDCEAC